MGQAVSLETLTQEGIKEIKDVKDTHAMMNLIFRYMLKQINVNDFMKLSEPSTCKEYVISLAEHMSSQFHRLQITPYREKKSDVLLFKKYSDLDPSKKSERHSEEEKRSLCLLLSYYYTRIFQIYGALAITLLNDISSSQTMSSSMVPSFVRPVNQTPGYEPTSVAQIKAWGGASGHATRSMGGAQKEEIQMSSFAFLSSYLVDQEPYSSSKGWRTIYDITKPNGGRVYFDKVATSISGGISMDIGRFMIYPPATHDRYVTLDVYAAPIKNTNEDVSLIYKGLKHSVDGASVSLPDSLKAYVAIRRTVGAAKPFMVHIEEKKNSVITMDVAHYLQGVFQELITTYLPKDKRSVDTSAAEKLVSEEKVPEPLRLGITMRTLQERRTAGHCIARALQLLRTIPSAIPGGPLSYESDICMEKFSFSARKYTGEVIIPTTNPGTRGIPAYGASLTLSGANSRGFHSFVQLFYDTIRVGSPQIIMGEKAFAEYQELMRTMAYLFRDQVPSSITPASGMDSGLASIRNRRDEDMCSGELKQKGMPIRIDPTQVSIEAVSDVVRELYAIQVKHAKQCGEIYASLFHITYDGKGNPLTISLSKQVLQGGFAEIDRINDRARKVLIDYYSMCEQKYVKGVNLIVEPARAQKAAATAAPPLSLRRSVSDPVARTPLVLASVRASGVPAPLGLGPASAASAASAIPVAPVAPMAPVAPVAPAPSRKRSSAPKSVRIAQSGGTRKRYVIKQ